MPSFMMLCGVPGSGKTRFARFYLDAHPDTVLISSDARIEQIARRDGLTYQESYMAHAEEVAQHIRCDAKAAMAQNLDILWDQTNLTADRRAEILLLAPDHYKRVAIAFEAPLSVLTERLAHRDLVNPRKIPPEILARQREHYQRPDENEGFDEIRLTQAPAMHREATE